MAGVKKQDGKESGRSKLRAEAEKKVALSAGKPAPLKERDLDKLVHELRVHQVELEMQNEELRGAQEQIAESRNDYADLYDFAPVGYLTFNGEALITGANLTGAALLGVERQKLLKRRFRQFVEPADAGLWDRHFVSVLQQGEKQSCDLLLRRKDGSTFYARLDSIRVEMDDGTCVARTGMSDITERKQAEEALNKSENLYRALIEHSSDVITIIDANGTVKYQSPNYKTVWGRDPSGEIGRDVFKDIHPDDVALVSDRFNYLLLNPEGVIHIEVRARHEDGSWLTIAVSGHNLLDNPAVRGIVVHFHDITERKKAEYALRESEARYRLLSDHMTDFIWLMDMDLKLMYQSPSAEKLTGFTQQDLMELPFEKRITPESLKSAADAFLEEIPRVMADPDYNPVISLELEICRRDGTTLWSENKFSVIRDEKGQPLSILGEARDITERKHAEEALRESEELFRVAQEMSPDGFTILHPLRNEKGEIIDFTWVYENNTIARINGTDPEEVKGKRVLDLFPTHKGTPIFEAYIYVSNSGKPQIIEEVYVGEIVSRPTWLRMAIVSMGEDIAILAQDITERKLAEEAILRAKQLLTTVIDSTPDWMYIKDFQHKFLLVNKSFADAQNLAPQDMIGRVDTYFFSEELCQGNPDKGIRGFHADDNQALQGQMLHNPRNMVTWADGLMHIYDTYKIPLTDQFGKTYAVLVYSRDITGQTKAEEEREVSFNTLKKTLNDAINTMVKIVEMRDPYTSGHQDKVADLAIAIAREMKLGDTRIDQLRMAALIHDIGKMYIPSDILSKPGKLADIELSLIRTHAQGGYNIVNGMNFPGVVAEAVLQHHERLDGSGYPNQLKGEDIMLEAKILAVADVIEAMASHRPYRSALGIDKALEELSKNRGRLYDPGVVDTCLYLFNSGRFEFKSV